SAASMRSMLHKSEPRPMIIRRSSPARGGGARRRRVTEGCPPLDSATPLRQPLRGCHLPLQGRIDGTCSSPRRIHQLAHLPDGFLEPDEHRLADEVMPDVELGELRYRRDRLDVVV